MIRLKRAYDPPAPSDGKRLLVERLWPRGVRKDALRLDGWLKELAPSTALRQWFGHDPARWDEFRRRYFAELDHQPEMWREVLRMAHGHAVTLIYSAHDAEHNNALALKEFLDAGGAA